MKTHTSQRSETIGFQSNPYHQSINLIKCQAINQKYQSINYNYNENIIKVPWIVLRAKFLNFPATSGFRFILNINTPPIAWISTIKLTNHNPIIGKKRPEAKRESVEHQSVCLKLLVGKVPNGSESWKNTYRTQSVEQSTSIQISVCKNTRHKQVPWNNCSLQCLIQI